MRHITVRNIKIDVIKKDIKNIHLAVYPPAGRVRIATPYNTDDEQLRLFAVSKLPWIKKHQKKYARQKRETKREYVSGESHHFEGERYLLNVVHQKGKAKVEVRNKTHIDLFVPEGTRVERRERVMVEWYREGLKERIPSFVEKWTKKIGIGLNDWRVRRMRTKWGTCNAEAGRILLNLELAKKPDHCLEYIIVHELVHFIERNHNDRYRGLMDQFLPTWRISRDELNQGLLSYEYWQD